MRLPHSLKSTHWVMWSSPVLLLVLVFTWTASSSSTPAHHLDARSATPPTHSTSDRQTPPTTVPVTTTTSPVRRTKGRATPRRTAPQSPPVVITPSTSTRPAASSSSATDLNVKSSANASAASASSGAVSGELSPTFEAAVVPLQGPGTWQVATSAPVSVTLDCAGRAVTVSDQFVIAAQTTCQVTITAEAPDPSVAWELTPTS